MMDYAHRWSNKGLLIKLFKYSELSTYTVSALYVWRNGNQNRHSFSNCYLIHEKRLSRSRIFYQWSSLFPSWWSRLRNPSPVVIAHLNYSATYRVVLCVCVMQEKGQMRPLQPTSVRWLFGKKFPLHNSFVSFSFLSLYISKRLRNSPYGFFFLRAFETTAFCGQWNCATFSFFSLVIKTPPKKKYWGITQDPIENTSE